MYYLPEESSMAFRLEQKDLEALLLGGCFFGSGGGGTAESARHLAANFVAGDYYTTASFEVVDVNDVKDGGETVMVAYLGAPEAIDGAHYPLGPVLAAQQIQQRLKDQGRKLAYVVPPESGALGFVVAGLVAAKLGLKVIDADGAGRAVPSLPMLTYAAAGVNPRPTMLVSQTDLCVELDVTPRAGADGNPSHQQDVSTIIDQMMRPIVAEPEFAQFGGLAMWIMDPETLARATPIRGTLGRALNMGRALQDGKLQDGAAVIAWLRKECDLPAYALFGPGTFVSAEVDTSGGFDLGKITIGDGKRSCTVLYQNESLLAWSSDGGQPLAMAPDSLAYVVEGAGQNVYSNGDLVMPDGSLNPVVKGRKVTLVGTVAAAPLRKPDGLILDSFMELARTMGYYGPYLPLGPHTKGEKA
jgi:DUF917 family protein